MFLKNKNIIFKIRRSKVTDYAALINAGDCHCPVCGTFFKVVTQKSITHLSRAKRPINGISPNSGDLDSTGSALFAIS